MEFKEKMKKYQENEAILQDALEEIMSQMKGRTVSYKKEIVDEKGNFSQEKLEALLDRMFSVWAKEIQNGTDVDATDYIAKRRELYRTYLYLVMRCSLFQTEKWKERTDFAFVLEQAKRMGGNWCVLEENGAKKSGKCAKKIVFGSGEEDNFGLHFYHILQEITPSRGALDELETGVRGGFTDEGACKRIQWMVAPQKYNPATGQFETDEEALKVRQEAAWAREAARLAEEAGNVPETAGKPSVENEASGFDEDLEDDDDIYGDWEEEDDDYEFDWDLDYIASPALQEIVQKQSDEENFRNAFANEEEYLAACARFMKLYCEAKPTLLKDFYEEIEQIVDWYLLSADCTVLTDGEKTMDVYRSIKEKALVGAKRYARGITWNRR